MAVKEMLRLAVFIKDPIDVSKLYTEDCTCILALVETLTELWIKCRNIDAMTLLLEQIIRESSILAFGTLTGHIVLPRPKLDIESIALEDLDLPSNIEIEVVDRTALRKLLTFSPSRINIDAKTWQGSVSFRTAPKASQLFDIGIRVVKPAVIPPKQGAVTSLLKRLP